MQELLIDRVEKRFQQALDVLYPELQERAHVMRVANEKFGHYQCTSPMKLAKLVQKSPQEIANLLIDKLDKKGFAEVSVAGPGFINVSLDKSYLSEALDKAMRDPYLGVPRVDVGERIIVEFSSPNIAKEMHVGHLRSTIIGDCLARLFSFLGADVLRLNHVGDWGTAFGMLIAYLKKEKPKVLTGEEATNLTHLMQWYQAAKQCFDSDEVFKEDARQEVVALQSGELTTTKAWEVIVTISRHAFQKIYNLLDIAIEERGESFYNPMLSKVVSDLEKKGLVTLSDGAKCLFFDKFKIPLMVQKSDGGYNYDTTDVAAMLHRIQIEKAHRIIVVTDAGQSLHFQLVEKACRAAGYLDPHKVRFDHVTFGLVLGADGKKFKTRSGETVKLIDLIHEAIAKAHEILKQRELDFSKEEVDVLAHTLGIGAIKYADLSTNRIGDYQFSTDKMLRFEGNTATFILYSYVRVKGIKRKLNITNENAFFNKGKIALKHPSEISLGLHLLQFGEVLMKLREDLMPNHLTDYLYALAQKFNLFFRDCRVEGSKEQHERLLLCESVARTMERGLDLLGLKVASRM